MNDFRYALRTLRRSPGVALVAVASLALGIGANTAIFSVANAVILRSMPVEKPAELVVVRYVSKKGNIFDSLGYSEYMALRDANAVGGLAALSPVTMNLSSQDATERVSGMVVTGNFFDVLKAHAHLGRLISSEDDTTGDPVCVISHDLWQRRFGSATDIIGQRIEINGKAYRILGVTAKGFDGIEQGERTQVYVPLAMAPAIFQRQGAYRDWASWLRMIGRLRAGQSID